MRIFLTIIILISLFTLSCRTKNNLYPKQNLHTEHYIFKDSTWTETHGDSLKIEFKRKNDTVIQKWIDLKGTAGDGFDDSFNVISVWSTIAPLALDCNKKTKFIWDSLEFTFCTPRLIDYIDSVSKKSPMQGMGYNDLRNSLKNNVNVFVEQREYLPFELIMHLKFELVDLRKHKPVLKMFVESYTTDFSGGRNFILMNKMDTLGNVHVMDWIR